jgi:hypothetical protein
MSAAAFAEHCGVKYPTFASWIAKGKRSASGNPHCESDDPKKDNPLFPLSERLFSVFSAQHEKANS